MGKSFDYLDETEGQGKGGKEKGGRKGRKYHNTPPRSPRLHTPFLGRCFLARVFTHYFPYYMTARLGLVELFLVLGKCTTSCGFLVGASWEGRTYRQRRGHR